MSPREDRLRSSFTRLKTFAPDVHKEVIERASRSHQPVRKYAEVYVTGDSGLISKETVFELANPDDLAAVFAGITRGLFYKLTGRLLPQEEPVRSVILPRWYAARIPELPIAPPRFRLGEEFGFAPVLREEPRAGIWLYLAFNSVMVMTTTGDAVGTLRVPEATQGIADRPIIHTKL